MEAVTLALLFAVAVAAVVVVGLDRFALRVVQPPHREPERSVEELPFRADSVELTSSGFKLHGWIARPAADDPSRAVVLLVHGWGYTTERLLPLAVPLVERGHPVLALDARGHGGSEPAPFVTIRHYRDDVDAAARFAAERFPDRARVVLGHSMGGAAAVLAAAEGAPVDGVGVLAGPADIREITEIHLNGMGLPGGLLVPLCEPFWRRRAGVESFDLLSPEIEVAKIEVPVAIFHGTDDVRVPEDHARRLAEAGGCRFELLEGEGHTRILESPELHRVVGEFLDDVAGS